MNSQKAGLYLAACIFLMLALMQALFGYYFSGQGGFSVGNDDSFISYRYAKNLIDAGIPTFNISEARPVEGYSNPLHVALSALIYGLVGTDFLYPVMAGLGALAVAAAIVLIGAEFGRTTDRTGGIAIALVLACVPSLWIHSTSGLETAFVFLLQVIVWLSAVHAVRSHGAGGVAALMIASVLLVTLRTDGFLFPLIAAGWLFWAGRRALAVKLVLACAATFAAIVGLRLWYYGLPMPLPTYVKVSGPLGDRFMVAISYLGSIAYKNGFVFPLLGAAVAALAYLRDAAKQPGSILRNPPSFELFSFSALIAYYCLVGGDIYRERFIIIAFPLGLFLLFRIVAQYLAPWMRGTAVVVALVAVVASFASDPRLAYRFDLPKYDRWVVLGRYLAEHHEGDYLATGAAGKIPYFSGLRTLDMLGLNTPAIAFTEAQGANPGHNKFDPDYVFAQQPDLICSHIWGDGQMPYGLARDRYIENGYVLRYLVASRADPGLGLRVLTDGESADPSELIASGYDYGCVLRDGQSGPSGT